MVDNVCADLLLVWPWANGSCFGWPWGLVSCLCCSPFYTDMEYCIHIWQPACAFGKIDSSYILWGGVYIMAQGGGLRGTAPEVWQWYCSYGTTWQCSTAGGAWAGASTTTKVRCQWWPWWAWLYWYWGGWGWWGRNSWGAACDGWGAWASWGNAACNATNYWGGGGGSCSSTNGCGCQWVVDICYPADWSYGIHCATWGTKSLVSWMCVHRFTSDGTFCIVS